MLLSGKPRQVAAFTGDEGELAAIKLADASVGQHRARAAPSSLVLFSTRDRM